MRKARCTHGCISPHYLKKKKKRTLPVHICVLCVYERESRGVLTWVPWGRESGKVFWVDGGEMRLLKNAGKNMRKL